MDILSGATPLIADVRQTGSGPTIVTGSEAIDGFYRESIERAAPAPELLAPLLIDGSRVGSEIRIALADDSAIHVLDLFVIVDGLIQSLTYFISDHP